MRHRRLLAPLRVVEERSDCALSRSTDVEAHLKAGTDVLLFILLLCEYICVSSFLALECLFLLLMCTPAERQSPGMTYGNTCPCVASSMPLECLFYYCHCVYKVDQPACTHGNAEPCVACVVEWQR